MQGGFSFCGVDIETIGLHYVPSLADTYVFKESAYSIVEESINSHDGGYFYGTSSQPKTFTLRCYFEDHHINDGIMTKIGGLFTRGRTGKLLFKHRTWIWYNATVTNVDYSGLTNYMNGFITIQMKAYYPFGRFKYLGIPQDVGCFILDRTRFSAALAKYDVSKYQANDLLDFLNNSGLIFEDNIPPTEYTNISYNKDNILLYNGGNERASVAILISGDAGAGILITNKTTNQSCKIVGMKKADGKTIICDGLNGKTISVSSSGNKLYAFANHDGGFIDLAPSCPIKRNVKFTNAYNGTYQIQCITQLDLSDIDKYILISSKWYKIKDVNGQSVTLYNPILSDDVNFNDVYYSDVVVMNLISINALSTMAIDKVKFTYSPTFK